MNPSELTASIISTVQILVLLFAFSYSSNRSFCYKFFCSLLKADPSASRSLERGVPRKRPPASHASVPEARPHRQALCSESSLAKVKSVNAFSCPLPEDICGRIACLVGFQGVGALSGCDRKLQSEVWDSREVWMSLSVSTDLAISFSRNMAARDVRDIFRRTTFRTDLSRLRALDKVGRWKPILDEATQVACGLLPGDVDDSDLVDFIKIGSRCLGAHDPESPHAVRTAERLLRASRRYMDLFTEEQLEHLEYAYKSVHQLHALMLSSMQESHEGLLQRSMWAYAPDPEPEDEPLQRSSVGVREPAPMPKHK